VTDAPLLFYTLLALCPGCGRRFLLGIAEDDVRDLAVAGTQPQELSQTLIDLHRSRRLMCLDCGQAEAN
jgi:hypothetical protein